MTGQAQRRRTTRSTAMSTATSATTHTSTQIHSGMVRLLPRAGCGRTGCCHTSQVVVAGAEQPPRAFGAAVRGPCRLQRPRTSRPVACQAAARLAAARVKGAHPSGMASGQP
jgi:hypothetical protein